MSAAQYVGQRALAAEVDAMARYLRDISAVPRLTAEEEVALGQRIARGDRAALHRMVEANLRLVVSVAKAYRSEALALLDLVQEGNLGLIGAARHYDPSTGYRFSTYAFWWIRRAVSRAVAGQGKTSRAPSGEDHSQSRRQIPWPEQSEREAISSLAPVPEGGDARPIASERKSKAPRPLSLDRPASDGQDQTLGDTLEDPAALSPLEEAEQLVLHERLMALLDALPSRERTLIELRFGLADGRPRTLREVGGTLGVTRERARQLEIRALQRLRRSEEACGLRTYLGGDSISRVSVR